MPIVPRKLVKICLVIIYKGHINKEYKFIQKHVDMYVYACMKYSHIYNICV